MRKSTTMASSKKPKEEEKKKKSGSSGKEAKALKTPDKKTGTHKKQSKHKPKSDNKNNRSRNGTVDESEVPGDPSSSTESDESEPEREERSIKTKNERNKSPKPKKRKQKGGEEDDGDDEQKEEAKLCRIPMNRIKRIIKSGDCNKGITQDAIFLVNKATEKFLEQFCEDAYWFTVKDRKKSLSYKHLSSVVSKQKKYEFLSDFVPEKVKAEDALKEMKFSERELG